MTSIQSVLLGAGQRGTDNVGRFALDHPDELKFVAVAEPDEARRSRFSRAHGIPEENRFASYRDLLAKPLLAPLCFNNTMDRDHLPSSIMALDRGYHLFLEKPIADTKEGCLKIARKARETRKLVQICHPMRYSPFYRKVKELLDDDAVGEVTAIDMHENVEHGHFAHAFVRGNWRNVEKSGPFILTKCCHDMDLIVWLTDRKIKQLASFGALKHFRAENAPAGAPEHCLDGCPVQDECLYYAPAIYLTPETNPRTGVLGVDQSPEARRKALETSPYGRCVYRCDNSTVDFQSVLIACEDDSMVNFSVCAHSVEWFRTIRVLGSAGELNGHIEKSEISIHRFEVGKKRQTIPDPIVIHIEKPEGTHAGGDPRTIRNFLRSYKEKDFEGLTHSLDLAVAGHLLAFAAEEARTKNKIVQMDEFT